MTNELLTESNDRVYEFLIKKHKELAPSRVLLPLLFQPIISIGALRAAPGELIYFNDTGIYRALADDFDHLARGILFDVIGQTAWIRKIGLAWLQTEDATVAYTRGQSLWLSKTLSGAVVAGNVPTTGYQQFIGHVINTRRAQGLVLATCNIVDPTQTTLAG